MARVTLGEVAKESRETLRSSRQGLPVVGLEHLEPGALTLDRWDEGVGTTFTKAFHKDQMLFGRRRAYLKKAALAPFDGICSGDITVIEARPDKMLPELLPFLIQNDSFFDFAVGKSAGSLSPRVKWEHLSQFEFTLPSIEEQKKLSDLFWAAYETQKSYKELLSSIDSLVKSQFIEMFGDPVTNPMGWEVRPFSAFADIDAVMTTDYANYADYPHIGIDSIESGTGELKGFRTVKQDGVKSGKYLFSPNHIIYSKIRPNLNKVALPHFEGLCSADAYPVRAKDNCNKLFLAYMMRSELFLMYILPLSQRTNFPKANREQIMGFSMPLPPITLQNQFATFVEQADKSKFVTLAALQAAILYYKGFIYSAE